MIMQKIYRIKPVNSSPVWAVQDGDFFYPIQNFSYDPLSDFEILNNAVSGPFEILAPFEGNQVFGLAYNYKSLVSGAIQSEPLIFLKAPSSVIGPSASIVVPRSVEKVWIEVELAIIVGKNLKNATIEECTKSIFGYSIGNDVTALNVDSRDWHLARSKALDTFCPLGPFIARNCDLSDVPIRSYINNTLVQSSTTGDRILNDAESLSLISSFIRLKPGDVVLTGTPAGATDALVKPGDNVTLEVDYLGSLTNNVVLGEA